MHHQIKILREAAAIAAQRGKHHLANLNNELADELVQSHPHPLADGDPPPPDPDAGP